MSTQIFQLEAFRSLLTDWNNESSKGVTTDNSSVIHDILRSHLPMKQKVIVKTLSLRLDFKFEPELLPRF